MDESNDDDDSDNNCENYDDNSLKFPEKIIIAPNLRRFEDTLRGKIWRVFLGVPQFNAKHYQSLIAQKEF